MGVEDLPDLNPPDFGNVCDPARPILSFSWRFEGAHRAAAHRHPRAHIIHPTVGAYWAITPEGRWLVPAGQALWIPPDVHHQVYATDTVVARMLFVDPASCARLPVHAGTVCVSPLLAELMLRAVEYGNEEDADGRGARLAAVLLDELAAMEVAPLLVPVSTDERLARVMAHVLDDPGADVDLAELGRSAGASQRTLARLFKVETGMTFSQWRTQVRLVQSIDRLAGGATVTAVAADLGYSTTSAFVHMFRTNMGTTPGAYVLDREHRPIR
jgi:AraC-like DNA-binding protein